MNKTIRRASVFCLLLVLALLVRATWVQTYESKALADNKNNRRTAIAQYAKPLGDIIVGGRSVTGSKRTDGGDLAYKRTYADGDLYSAVTGYSSQAYGSTQLEGIYSDVLDGTDSRLKNPIDALTGKQTAPGDVLTTIDPSVQKAGYEALGSKKGAAVAIDPKTGQILGMVSTPSYDPSKISGTTDGDAWKQLTTDKNQPMLNRALRQPLPPGSTFKLVVASAALEDGLFSSIDEKTDSPDPYRLPGTTTDLTNESASDPCKNATLRTALEYSCNTVFAKVADDLGQDKVKAMAEKFGFNDSKQDVPVRAWPSNYPSHMDKAQTALSGIGQFDVTATPLQMAMVTSALANDGVMADPHMVSKVTDGDGNTLQSYGKDQGKRIVSSSTAAQLQSAMQTVVEQGTGSSAKVPGAVVGGKTGTAQHGVNNDKAPYAWFTSYAKDKSTGKEVAVAVLVEDSDAARAEVSGNGLAGPVAQKMMAAALK
ncbi:penicillin-binding protein 2 [Streptomyces sp. NBC_01020]|uniref:peptidoglycan D,D-transpeptidase FtsI family protein n=1 Tax=unclassified Streptomyces TaxID=2593676 RepID=UPI0022576B60|nr:MULTISPECIES: penicillin-binding protein 2 [unclassified Streptomyces]MCX4727326.1 penicillin-binding protein 2 [Streptomyces sp. NBC_01306]WSV03434.1 penicillin-binding protein 2 [Streptomyces sp. NBC_01020]WSX41466.1 penicillin-binding protein 2 [Streptomyces sp. NBC_00963]